MSAFKVGDRVRYVGGYTPFYVSPKPNAEGTVTHVPDKRLRNSHVSVEWDDRLRYCKETDNRNWAYRADDLEKVP